MLVGEPGGVALGETTKHDGPPLGQVVDLLLDLPWVAHASANARRAMDIPWMRQSRGQTKNATTTAAPTTSAATANHVSAAALIAARLGRAGASRVSELVEPVLVESEVVGQFVQDGDADLVLELVGVVAEVLHQRLSVD